MPEKKVSARTHTINDQLATIAKLQDEASTWLGFGMPDALHTVSRAYRVALEVAAQQGKALAAELTAWEEASRR